MSDDPGGRGNDRDNPGAPRVGYEEKEHRNGDGGQHHTLYDTEHNDHISWDSDRNGDYTKGGQDRGGRRINNWPDR